MPSIDNKKKTQQNKTLYVFLTAFFVSLIVLTYIFTAFTPDIDVDVNANEQAAEADRPDIDSRLRELQQDELITSSPKRENEESSSDIIEQLKKLKEEAIEKQRKTDEQDTEDTNEQQVTKSPSSQPQQKTTVQASKMAKVYVGRYSNFDEAIKVQDALIQSSLASSPFIKNLGSYYVVQIGSYANQQTAQNIAENLIEHGYSARMVLE